MYQSEGLATVEPAPVAVETWTEPSFRATWLRWNPDAEDCAHSLYRPDCMVPELSFERLRRTTARSGEGRLALAVLEDAVDCFQKHLFASRPRHRRLFREAEAWLFADSRGKTTDAAFTFDYICDAIGIERDAIRRALMRSRDQRIAERDARRIVADHREAA
jgi:hypothetical protein